MSLLSNKPLMLTLIGLLLAIKFVLQPIVEWQNKKVDDIFLLERQLNKGLGLIQNEEILKSQLSQVSERLKALTKTVLGRDENVAAYQLRVQKQIEELMEKHDIVARNVNWLSPQIDGYSEEHKIEMNLSGQSKDFVLFLLDIEQTTPKMAVVEFSTLISRQYPSRKKLGNITGRLVLAGWRATDAMSQQGELVD